MLEFKHAGSRVNMALATIGHHSGSGHGQKKKNSNKVQVLPTVLLHVMMKGKKDRRGKRFDSYNFC